MTWEELVSRWEMVEAILEEYSAELSVIKNEAVIRVETEKTSGKVVGKKTISIRTTYTTSKDVALELGAIKKVVQERIDTGMIKTLYFKGIKIKDLQINKTSVLGDVEAKPKNES